MSDAREQDLARRGLRLANYMTLLIAPLLVLAAAVFLLMALRNADLDQREVEASYERRAQIQRVFSLLQDMETGQRGYVITGRAGFLEPYDHALRQLDSQITALEQLLRANPAQRGRLQTLKGQSAAKQQIMAQAIAIRRTEGAGPAAAHTASERGKVAMDAIRATVDAMIQAESSALDARLAEARGARVRVEIFTGLLLAMILGALALSAVLVRRHTRARQILIDQISNEAARQQAIFEGSLDAIVTFNPSGSIETMNRAAEAMFGWKREELRRRDISLIADLAPGEGAFLRRLGGGDPAGITGAREVVGRRRNGATFDAEIALGSMQQSDGIHGVAAIRDVSDRKQAERAKDEFVSTVSHELRTPITSIAGSLGLLESGAAGALSDKAARLVYIARTSCERLVRLINDLLDIEKIAAGKVRFDMQPLDLRTAARQAIQDLGGFAGDHGVTIRLTAPDAPLTVNGDMDRLVQVFTNLVSNAVKFSPPGGRVDVSLRGDEAGVRARVSDQGPGVPESFHASIFGKFAQADSSSARAKGGAGLGLAISKEILDRHQGRIRLVSAPGDGAVFEFELPPAAAEPAANAPRQVRLLVCEGDPQTAETLARSLERDGFAVDQAHTCASAVEAASSGGYAAVVLGLPFPDGEGVALVRRLAEESGERRPPIIVVSAEPEPDADLRGGVAIADWIDTPLDPGRLSRSVRKLLSGNDAACILHLDDDPDLVEVVRLALAGAGEVLAAPTLHAARSLVRRRRFDLVVLDVGLPDGSGLDLLAEISRMEPKPPVIVYSGEELDPQLLDRVDAVLTKSRTSIERLVDTAHRLTRTEGA
ncbi:CHASE3 domain-containing protein [Phenylobacterium sp. LjRoot219]|uniref:CHASE3 domain-containing protein n=1 Tax=Phenylobacterium sp. LjRoot219 TaxID=3342283 RepID=UPI003ECD5005